MKMSKRRTRRTRRRRRKRRKGMNQRSRIKMRMKATRNKGRLPCHSLNIKKVKDIFKSIDRRIRRIIGTQHPKEQATHKSIKTYILDMCLKTTVCFRPMSKTMT